MVKIRMRNPTPLQWGLIFGATTLTVGLASVAFAATRRRGGRPGEDPLGPVLPPGEREPDEPGAPGSGEIVPSADNQGPPPKKRGWGGGQYGKGGIPKDFDWNGNLVYISPDCKVIAEGRLFLPIPGWQDWGNWWMPVNGGPSAQATLADALRYVSPSGQTGTAWGYVARLVARYARDGVEFDEDVVREIGATLYEEIAAMQAKSPACPDPLNNEALKGSPTFKLWWEYLIARLAIGIYDFEDGWYFWNQHWEDK